MSERNAAGELTKRAFAETYGVSEAQLERLFQQGLPHAKRSTRKVAIPMPEGRIWYHNYLVEKGKRAAAPKDIDEAKHRKMAAEAELAEIELEKAREELMTVAEFEKAIGDAFSRVRARLTNLAPRLAGVVLGAGTVQEAQARAEPLVREAMEELRAADDVPAVDEEPSDAEEPDAD
jgi:hypothetical protein